MNLLLDTHIILWWLDDDSRLPADHRESIADADNLCYISAATIWEIAIKKSLGKLEISEHYLYELEREGFMQLPVTWIHADHVAGLPRLHTDPFDRLLIAQAQLEGMTLLSVDGTIKQYDVAVL